MTGAHEPTEYLVQHVKEALATDERVSELGLEVEIHGSDVYLSGTVATEARRGASEEVVRELLPGRTIHNQIGIEEIFDSQTKEQLS